MTKLKVLQLFGRYLPFTENWIANLLSQTKNIEHHIGAFEFLNNDFKSLAFNYVEGAGDPMYSKLMSGAKKGWPRILERLQISWYHLLHGTTAGKLKAYCKNQDIQLLHAHFGDIGWRFLPLKKSTRLPMLISFYGWDYEMLPHLRPEYKQRYKRLFEIVEGFICEGRHGAKILARQGCPQEKIFVVPLGVQVSKISFQKRIKKPNQLKLIQLASFTEKKGHQYAIAALGKIIHECPNIQLTFIGNERTEGLKAKLIQQVHQLGLENHVHFKEPVDYDQLQNTLSSYDVFIHPSCYAANKDCEGGAPIVLLDAQASGMPVIATTHCDIPDEVIHEKTGLLSVEKKVHPLAENIRRFYKMENDQYQTFATNARAHVKAHFDTSKNAKTLEVVYEKIIGN